tara:strand:+ start:16061 stop:18634 length:2574 start_codon:yes stop_codon:yes gene_type:complete
MKKIIKISVGILIIIFGLLIATPYFFKDKIVILVKETINNNVHAKVDFNNVNISLISSFPKLNVSLNNFVITTFKPFEGDTLASAKRVSIKLPLSSLFKSTSEIITINYFSIDESNITILINEKGEANYNIGKKGTTSTAEKTSQKGALNLSLDGYKILNSTIYYSDETSGMNLKLENFNHKGSGNLSTSISELKTETAANVSFEYDKTNYINNQLIELKANIGIDLNENKFTFLENEALINQLPLVFDGFVKLNDTNQELDINFKTPSSDFKNFLALIPEKYSKDISNVKTTGNFTVEGSLKGIIDAIHIPQFNIQLASNNASFKYPDLPKTIQNIEINTVISNTTGVTNDTKVNVKNVSFKIDGEQFSSSALINTIINNPTISAKAKGTINLNHISQAYPMGSIKNLQGILKADFETIFDMKSIEQKKYGKTKNTGNISLQNFKYEGNEMANPIEIYNSQVTFTTKNVQLNTFEAKTGNSDLKMNGTIENLIGFILNNENIKGNFNLNSTTFNVNDFMLTETAKSKEGSSKEIKKEQLKIPSFLDCTINANASTVIYDNLNLKNVKGTLIIKDEKAVLNNLSSGLFGGALTVNGVVSTKTETSTFNLDMDIYNFDISQSFTQLEMFKALAPISNLVQGKINTKLKVSGNLNDDLTPNLSSISGNALSEILSSTTTLKNSKALSLLSSNLNFIDLDKLNLNNLKATLSFENGKVSVKPFNLKYDDIDIEVSGKHGFDKTVDYNLAFNIPAKYMGNDVSKLLTNLSGQEKDKISIPVTATILGTFNNPTVKTDIKQAASNLTQQLLNQQKGKIINQGIDKLNNLLNNNKKSADSTTTTNDIKKAAGSLLNGLFKKKN